MCGIYRIVNVIVGMRGTDDTKIFQIYKTFYYLKYIKNKGMEIAKRIVFYSVKGPSPMPHCSFQKLVRPKNCICTILIYYYFLFLLVYLQPNFSGLHTIT